MQRWFRRSVLVIAGAVTGLFLATEVAAQVTTGSMRGVVSDSLGNPLEGARIIAIHTPSGTQYQGVTRADGRFTLPGMRVGGPYNVSATRIGFARQSREDINVSLGVATDLAFRLGSVATTLGAVTVTSTAEVSSTRTGAATTVSRQVLEALPTISRGLNDFTRLTPQASGSSFAGQDNRLNNITVDGSYFNNSFGLAGQPGERTGVAAISLDAVEAVQVNVAPFDVRQGNFVGAAVNTVTKSGTNQYTGSLYYLTRDNSLVGKKAGLRDFNPGTFNVEQFGGRIGGPIIKNKLFFFASLEQEETAQPGTTFRANEGGEAAVGNVTRVLRSSLDSLSTYLQNNFNYTTGPYQDYEHKIPALRFTGKLDYAMSDRNKFSLRYTHLDSDTDVLLSNSSSLGFGTRRTNNLGLNFQNSNYKILENIRSVIGEWNSQIGDNKSNNMILGYTFQDESRGAINADFPMVDILEAGTVYTTFGPEPFTPNNELRYSSLQFQNNFTIYGNKFDWTFGLSVEQYESENVFFPGRQSAYVYNSLADFYTDANDFIANPGRTVSPVSLRRFQVRWSNIPGQEKPVQPLEVLYGGVYAQTEWRATRDLKLTFGLRADRATFGNTAFDNAQANAYTYADEFGDPARFNTSELPKANILWSPRLGLNWDLAGDGVTQVRGGTGIFTGRPAYVWISNQIGNNGVLTGFESIDNTTARPFNPDPDAYKPATVTGAPAASYELAFTDKDFRFPQIWRSNLAVDRKLPWNVLATAEVLYAKDVNGVYYIDANLSAPESNFAGPDQRPRWSVDDCPTFTGTNQRRNCNVTSAIVLKNQNVGESWNVSASLERAFTNGLFAKVAYARGISRNTVDPGSIAFGSWNNNQHSGNPNQPGVAFSGNSQGRRIFATFAYQREFFKIGATGVSLYVENRRIGNGSYTYGGDMNGDGGTSNDLLYIPRGSTEIIFLPLTASGVTWTPAQQAAAWDIYQDQDHYLSNNRGEYAERGAVWLPTITRADVSFTQDIGRMWRGKVNKIQLRFDILNFTNMFNKDWGVSRSFVSNQPLVPAGVNGAGVPQFRMRNIGTRLLTQTFQKNAGLADVWQIQMGVRYNFN